MKFHASDITKWADIIIKLYQEQVVTNWPKKVKFVNFNDTMAAKVID